MILSGKKIIQEQENGRLRIAPFYEHLVNPNSYDVRLDEGLYELKGNQDNVLHINGMRVLDIKELPCTSKVEELKNGGYLLEPGKLYLGSTIEWTKSDVYVMSLEGKSSNARNGITVHLTAGVGDLGFTGKWTLEITVVLPTIIYPGMRIAQIMFEEVEHQNVGSLSFPVDPILYSKTGHYNEQNSPLCSRTYLTIGEDLNFYKEEKRKCGDE